MNTVVLLDRMRRVAAVLEAKYTQLEKESARRNSAYDHFGWDNTPESLDPGLCEVRNLVREVLNDLRTARPGA